MLFYSRSPLAAGLRLYLLLAAMVVGVVWSPADNLAAEAHGRSHPAILLDAPEPPPPPPPPTPTPAAAPAEPVHPFIAALAAAYETNPKLKAEREALQATDEGVAIAISGFRPSASASYDKGRQRSRTSAPWNYSDSTGKGITVEQPIFNGGETLYGYQSAKQRVKAGRAGLQAVEQQVLFDAVDAYSAVLEKQSVLELTQSNVGVLRQQRDATAARFEVGELTSTDVAQADARLSQAEADMRQAEGDLKAARAAYERVIGVSPDNLLAETAIPHLPETLEASLAVAAEANPSLLAARHAEKAADYDINTRVAALLPDVYLRGSMNRSAGAGFFGDFDNDTVTVNVSIPLYQSGAEYARVRAAKDVHQQSKYLAADMERAVREAVTRAYGDYQAALSVIASTNDSIKAAELARDGVKQENEFGVRTILDVLDAEQELFRTRVNLVRASRNKDLQAYRLLAAIGRLTAYDLRLPVERYDPEESYNTVKWLPAGF